MLEEFFSSFKFHVGAAATMAYITMLTRSTFELPCGCSGHEPRRCPGGWGSRLLPWGGARGRAPGGRGPSGPRPGPAIRVGVAAGGPRCRRRAPGGRSDGRGHSGGGGRGPGVVRVGSVRGGGCSVGAAGNEPPQPPQPPRVRPPTAAAAPAPAAPAGGRGGCRRSLGAGPS